MKRIAIFLACLTAGIAFTVIMASQIGNTAPVERTDPSGPAVQECPADTAKGAYHSRGYDKDGNVSCGFTYFNECPYYAGAEAGTPECEKGKPTPEQLEPWQPEETEQPAAVSECGGK
jgi:hypothetical protein